MATARRQKALPPSNDAHLGLEEALVRLWGMARRDPLLLVECGEFLRCNSNWRIGDEGAVERGRARENNNSGTGRFVKMRLNYLQREFVGAIRFLHSHGVSASIIGLKPRRGALSSVSQGVIFSVTITQSGVQTFIVAHHQKTAEGIIQKSHVFFEQFKEIHPFIETKTKRVNAIGFHSDHPVFAVTNSTIEALTSESSSIQRIRGEGSPAFHITEVGSMKNKSAIRKALKPVIEDDPQSIVIEESTGSGEEGEEFGEKWMASWNAQGRCNYNEPGFKLFASGTLAFFIGTHQDDTRRGRLQAGVTWGNFFDDLDEYEKRILEDVIMPWNLRRYKGDRDLALIRSLESLAFRRAQLFELFPRKLVMPSPGSDHNDTADEFRVNFPFIPEEALTGIDVKTVFSKAEREFLGKDKRDPIWQGHITYTRERGVQLRKDKAGPVKVYRWPHEVTRAIGLSIDPAPGVQDPDAFEATERPHSRDYTAAVAREWGGAGGIILTYETFASAVQCTREVYAITMFLAAKPKGMEGERQLYEVHDRRFPWLIEERGAGAVITDLLYNSAEYSYPAKRIFRHTNIEKGAGKIVFAKAFGFAMQRRKVWVIEVAKDAIRRTAAQAERPYVCVENEDILNQMDWFIEKDGDDGKAPLFEAAAKHMINAHRYDDHLLAWLINVAAEYEYNLAQVYQSNRAEISQADIDQAASHRRSTNGFLTATEAIAAVQNKEHFFAEHFGKSEQHGAQREINWADPEVPVATIYDEDPDIW